MHALKVAEQNHLILNEAVDLRKEINSANKQAQRFRLDKRHEASVLLCKIPYDDDIVNKSSDATIRELTKLRHEERREVAVLAHPETEYRSTEEIDPTAADDEADIPPDEVRVRRHRVKRHHCILVTRRVFNLYARKRRIPKSYQLAHVQPRNLDTTSFMARNIVTLDEVMSTIQEDPVIESDDDNSQISCQNENASALSQDASNTGLIEETSANEDMGLTTEGGEDGEILDDQSLRTKRVSFATTPVVAHSAGNITFRYENTRYKREK